MCHSIHGIIETIGDTRNVQGLSNQIIITGEIIQKSALHTSHCNEVEYNFDLVKSLRS